MLILELFEVSPANGPYYHDTLAAQLPAGLTDDNDIVGKAFVIAGMKMGMVKASQLFRYTPGFEQDVVAAYHRLHNELKETVVDDELGTAQEIGVQLQTAMEDLYYAHRMGNPNSAVKQNIDMLQKSIRSLNQELNGLGYKYAPTVPGLVAKMGTRYVEEDMNIDEIIKEAGAGLDIDRSVPGRIIARTSDNLAHRTGALTTKKLPDYHPDDDYTPWSGKIAASTHDDEEDTFDQDYTGDENGELDLGEGFRVAQPQIRGTQNRAQTAYYPSTKKPQVPKLDTPLSDQELARLSQLAGIKTNK